MAKRSRAAPSTSDVDATIVGFQLSSVLQLVQIERRSCRLIVRSESRTGDIWLEHGEPIHAVFRGQEGDEAILALLEVPSPRVQLVADEKASTRTVSRTLIQLLLEAARRADSDVTFHPEGYNHLAAKG